MFKGLVVFSLFVCLGSSLIFSSSAEAAVKAENPKVGRSDYGSFMISLGWDQPDFTELERYEDFYGDASGRFAFGVDYYLISFPYLALGAGFNFKLFQDDGTPLYQPSAGADLVEDPNGDIKLTVRQIDVVGKLLFTPHKSQYLTLSAWTGYSYLEFIESRDNKIESINATDDSSSKSTYVNEGSRNLITTGASIMFDITPFEESTVYTMIATLGIDKVYLAPYVSTSIDSAESGKADFSHQTYGVLFGFEAAK